MDCAKNALSQRKDPQSGAVPNEYSGHLFCCGLPCPESWPFSGTWGFFCRPYHIENRIQPRDPQPHRTLPRHIHQPLFCIHRNAFGYEIRASSPRTNSFQHVFHHHSKNTSYHYCCPHPWFPSANQPFDGSRALSGG